MADSEVPDIPDWERQGPGEAALYGLYEGSLAELADWLEQGGPVTPAMRSELVHAIRSGKLDEAYREYCDPTPSKSEVKAAAKLKRDLDIGAWVAVRKFLCKRGSYARIKEAAAIKFGISEASIHAIYNDYRKVKTQFEQGNSVGDSAFLGPIAWRNAFHQFCDERGFDHYQVYLGLYSDKKPDLDF